MTIIISSFPKVEYSAHGLDFELEIFQGQDEYVLEAHHVVNNVRQPVMPKYAASYLVADDYFRQYGEHIRDHLLAIAKSDIDSKMYLTTPHAKTWHIGANLLSKV